jgi:two-component system, OmpR family, response regulator
MRILVAEDSVKMAALLRTGLERAGYAVDLVVSGSDAMWMGTENAYDAIVLDVILEGAGEPADGFDVCRTLRDSGCWTPVLMVTARDAVEDRVRGLDVGADDYLPKPFSFDELLARLRALIRRGRPERPVSLAVGDLHLDPAAHDVRRAGDRIDLTPTEFALLEYLMRNAGRALTRSEILEHVWDFAYEGDPRIVNVYVRTLREKIDRPYGRSSVETVRGVGYRMPDAPAT